MVTQSTSTDKYCVIAVAINRFRKSGEYPLQQLQFKIHPLSDIY